MTCFMSLQQYTRVAGFVASACDCHTYFYFFALYRIALWFLIDSTCLHNLQRCNTSAYVEMDVKYFEDIGYGDF